MSNRKLYTLNEVKRLTGENRNLITYLVRDRQIPVHILGRSKVIDHEGYQALCEAMREYRAKPEPFAAVG